MPLELVIASANPHKAAELRELLGRELGGRVQLLDRPSEVPDVEETASTLEENARLKAVAIVAATGRASIADDTGLEVQALGGAPGVYSARYAGEDASYADNVAKLVSALEGVGDRTARFRSVCLVVFPDGSELVGEGAVDGEITTEPRGEAGFGYDSVFRPTADPSRTYGELSTAEKNAVSHRAIAIRQVAKLLSGALGAPN
jgi:XTP/dITP diphosphohydrolase